VDAESRVAIRRIRAAVVSLRAPRNIVAVTCCSPRAAEPGVAALLSDSLWKGGSSVVLVDGADNEPDPTGIFPHAAGPGLSDALLDRSLDASRMLVEVDPALRLLPRGRHGDEAVEHFLPKQLTEVVQLLDMDAEYVILRSPPISESGGEAMVSISAATVLLVTLGKTTYSELAAAAATVRREQGKLLGAVIVPAGRRLRAAKRSKRTRSSGGPKGKKAAARTAGRAARESDLADRTSRR
jgi:Mrp family chromosome partitioning ATPase